MADDWPLPYEEVNFVKCADDIRIRLSADYCSSAGDDDEDEDGNEDEDPAPPLKRKLLTDSGPDTSLNIYYKKVSFVEHADDIRLKGLVDYSSSSEEEDEDENSAPSLKRKLLTDSGPDTSLNSHGSSKSASEKEIDDTYFSYNGSTDEEDIYETDTDVLKLGLVDYDAVDKRNLREVYAIFVDGEDPLDRDKSKCLRLLDEIGCRHRFRGLSVEMLLAFFAKLNKSEAARIKGVKGVRDLVQYRYCYYNVV